MAATSRSLVHKFRIRELKRALPPAASTSSPTATVAVTNPFIPHYNQETGRWAPPRYSRRRQADLIKQARSEGNLHLLPPGPKLKLSEIRAVQPKRVDKETGGESHSADTSIPDIATPVEWLGEVKVREPIGADVGNTLYAGKKQMFKGHKWERVIRRRHKYQRTLMRHMRKRIKRWRLYRVKKRPWPLARARVRSRKSQKLPF